MRTRSVILVSVAVALVLGVGVSVFLHEHSEASSATKKCSITIVLDAGHGGKDPGAVVAGVKEKDIDLAVAKRVFSLAKEDDRLNPVMTRNADIYIALEDHVRLAEEVDAALYLSIQANACDYPDVEGIETWVDDIHSPGDLSWQLAEIIQSSVVTTGAGDRGGTLTGALPARYGASCCAGRDRVPHKRGGAQQTHGPCLPRRGSTGDLRWNCSVSLTHHSVPSACIRQCLAIRLCRLSLRAVPSG